MFEWKWSDIATECERFLGPNGFCGVQISPPNENNIVTNPNRPWWERYQPVSYKLVTRSGTEAQLKDMIERCNKVNVRIYSDTVINHMSSTKSSGHGTAGSTWNGIRLSFPGVPYSASDFNSETDCETFDMDVHNYTNANEVRNCRLFSLADLKLSRTYVRDKVTTYLNHLIDLGVAGFRIDAAQHIWPGELTSIMENLHDLNVKYFPHGTRPFVYQETNRLLPIWSSSRFQIWIGFSFFMRGEKPLKDLHSWGQSADRANSDDAVVFVENHDNERGHGNGAGVVSFFEPRPYKAAVTFMLANVASGSNVQNWWDNGDNQIAFSRGNKGFFVLNLEGTDLDQTLQTGLPSGTYCDVISGNYENGRCTGEEIVVGAGGTARFQINGNNAEPMIAIHIAIGRRELSMCKDYLSQIYN
ncbi:hypothetical protein KUTeg_000275 [Tegillarca granosa]|uniref:Alpha-amylase n=1 Tax=Tegillarca granosa TaxID=220873 RepID=A0ABQ9FX29_TEGGR|nr:hypothetical protein KUTeg_000275 [Tegillarca granosa]